MKTDTLYLVTGLPRSGSSVITNILKQNPKIHGEVNGSLCQTFGAVYQNWETITKKPSNQTTAGVLKGIVEGYFSNIDKPIVFDRNFHWVPLLPMLESVLQREIKIIVTVRNPAEILSSFEKARKENPLVLTDADRALRDNNSIAGRAYFYAGPDGILGTTHRNIKDAITMGYLDRMLFIDYGRYCNSPKSQTKRIYEFFELPEHNHDFANVQGDNMGTRHQLEKTTINCVEYIGLELFDQYNREIFWNAWV